MNLLWELPLALPSILLFTGLRFLLYRAAGARVATSPKWVFLDAEMIEQKLAAIMLIGPRWNTHAYICSQETPIRVAHTLTVRCPDASMVPLWSGVVRDGRRQAHHHVGTAHLSAGQESFELSLPAGLYSFACRYYDFRPGAMTPELWVDGTRVSAATALPSDASTEVYEQVRHRTGGFYRALAGYLYPVLCLREWLPEAFVRRAFLPVGNPDTTFRFGVVERGERLQIEVPAALLRTHRVLFTSYNRASFPVDWFRVDQAVVETAAMPCRGFWLIRVQAERPDAPAVSAAQIGVARASSRGT